MNKKVFYIAGGLLLVILIVLVIVIIVKRKRCGNFGKYKNGKCICNVGYSGDTCQYCENGYVYDNGVCIPSNKYCCKSTGVCDSITDNNCDGIIVSNCNSCKSPVFCCDSKGTCTKAIDNKCDNGVIVNNCNNCKKPDDIFCCNNSTGECTQMPKLDCNYTVVDSCDSCGAKISDKMILGGWLAPPHIDKWYQNKIVEKLGGMITDIMIGFYFNIGGTSNFPDNPTENSKFKSMNDNVLSFIGHYLDKYPNTRFWIIIYRDEYQAEIWEAANHYAETGGWIYIAGILRDRLGPNASKVKGIIVDWERSGGGNAKKNDVSNMIKIHEQVRQVVPSWGVRINISNYDECLSPPLKDPNKSNDWCPDGPSNKSFHDFLALPDTYFDFQQYGGIDCKSDDYPYNPGNTLTQGCFNKGNCTIDNINSNIDKGLQYINSQMCEHITGGNKKFLADFTTKERSQITIGTYPTSPEGLYRVYKDLWGKYGMGGYWFFDIVFILGCDDNLISQYRTMVTKISKEIDSLKPVDWQC